MDTRFALGAVVLAGLFTAPLPVERWSDAGSPGGTDGRRASLLAGAAAGWLDLAWEMPSLAYETSDRAVPDGDLWIASATSPLAVSPTEAAKPADGEAGSGRAGGDDGAVLSEDSSVWQDGILAAAVCGHKEWPVAHRAGVCQYPGTDECGICCVSPMDRLWMTVALGGRAGY